MGKLAIIGAILLGSGGSVTGVTAHQARHELVIDAKALPTSQISCHADGLNQVCQVFDQAPYTDAVIGPAIVTGTTVFEVSRRGHNYRVRVIVPDQTSIYGN